jgi:hypothetical protein
VQGNEGDERDEKKVHHNYEEILCIKII